jgi:asparagine synthase (glutamine-hydrolysing)
MGNEDGSVQITFNGEIYNFRKLRKELLELGHTFKSTSDTEVVIHLYEEMGTDCLSRLEGMFAFALWDERKKILFMARDRIGKKPLHYAVDDEGIIFGSEIKALLEHPKVSREIDAGALSKYLTYEYVPAPDSIFKAIKKLEPGHFLVYGEKAVRHTKYWDIPLSDFAVGYKTESEYMIELRDTLETAVAARLVADVPVGIFLSGGLDSSLVAALAKKSNDQIECFSIGFDEKSFDESAHAVQVARSLNLKHHLEVFAMKEMLENIEALSRMLDEPLADASVLPTYLLSKITAKKVKVALSGDGGDELFAGYPTYQAHRLITYYDSLPEPLKNTVKRVAARLPVSHSNISHDFKIKQFLRGAGVSSEIRFFIWMGGFLETEKRNLLTDDLKRATGGIHPFEDVLRYIHACGLTKDLERILYLSMKLYLQDDILVKVDRASMANSLEVRCPFLDQRVVEFACGLPTLYKLNGLTTKYLLKKTAAGMLPRNIVQRKKKGFGVPVSRWLSAELKQMMMRYLSPDRIKRQGFFNEVYVKNLMEEHLAKKKDNRKLLWTLLIFQIWHENHLAAP